MKKAQNSGGFVQVVLLVLVVVAIGGVYYFRVKENKNIVPTTSPIPLRDFFHKDLQTRWNVYKNENVGYELSYPENWYGSDCDGDSWLLLSPDEKYTACAGPSNDPVQLHISSYGYGIIDFEKGYSSNNFKILSKDKENDGSVKYTIEEIYKFPKNGITSRKIIARVVTFDKGLMEMYVYDPKFYSLADEIFTTLKFTK